MKTKVIELIKRFVLALISVVCIISATFSWFKMTEVIIAEPLSILATAGSQLNFELYIKKDSVFTRTYKLEYENLVPYENVEYKLIIKNDTEEVKNASVSFLEITEAVENGAIKLCDELILSEVIATGANVITPLPSSFSTLMGSEDNFTLVNNIEILANTNKEVFFTVKLSENASNDYQNKKITIGQLSIVHT